MAQIIKVRKKVRKTSRGHSAMVTIQDLELKKYVGKEVVIRISLE